MSSKLYRFKLYCGRMGSLEGLFVRKESEVKKLIGKSIYFGEVLGKHSEISEVMKEEYFTVVTDDADFIKKFDQFKCASGHNPFDYLDE